MQWFQFQFGHLFPSFFKLSELWFGLLPRICGRKLLGSELQSLVVNGLFWVWTSTHSSATLWLWTSFSNKAGFTVWTSFVSFASESLETALDKDDPQESSHFSDEWYFCHDGVVTLLKHSSFFFKSLSFLSALSLSFISSLSFFSSSTNCWTTQDFFFNVREGEIKSQNKASKN